jgi:hypothetical protein
LSQEKYYENTTTKVNILHLNYQISVSGGHRQLKHEADQSPAYNVNGNNMWDSSECLSVLLHDMVLKDMDNFTFCTEINSNNGVTVKGYATFSKPHLSPWQVDIAAHELRMPRSFPWY